MTNTSITLSYKQLMTKFKSRLNTQDRAYTDVMYIPALINNSIKKIPDNGKKYREMVTESLENMKIYYSDDSNSYCFFKDINDITINSSTKEVSFNTKFGKHHTMYTETSTKGVFKKMNAVDFKELSIDHDYPEKMLLSGKSSDYPYLYKLSELTKDNFGCVGTDYKTMKVGKQSLKDAAGKKSTFDAINSEIYFSQELFDEIREIYNNLSYSIMYSPYNSAKSDNT